MKKDKDKKVILYIMLFVVGLLSFTLQLFVFEAPDGFIGFILCLVSIYLIIGSIIKLCRLSEKFKNSILGIIDLLFWIP